MDQIMMAVRTADFHGQKILPDPNPDEVTLVLEELSPCLVVFP